MSKEELTVEPVEEERTMWDDCDEALLRAQQIFKGSLKLPETTDTMEMALAKIIVIINKLVDKADSKIIL